MAKKRAYKNLSWSRWRFPGRAGFLWAGTQAVCFATMAAGFYPSGRLMGCRPGESIPCMKP